MPPAVTGNFSNHLAPGIRAVIGANLGGRESYYSMFYDIETSERNYEDYLAAAGLPIAALKPQSEPIVAYDPLEGSTKRVSFDVWAIGFEVSEEAWEDDLYADSGSALRSASNGIADSLAERVEIEAHRPLNAEGYDGSTYTVLPDSSGLFATSHSPVAGGEAAAQSNRSATDADLSVTSYRVGLTQFRKYTNDRGLRIPGFTMPARLITPVDLEWDAGEVVNSSNRPDTMNRVENVSKGKTSVEITPYITNDDTWSIQGAKHFMKFFWRFRPRLDSFDDRRTRTAVYVGYQRFKVAPIHWLGMYGSNGS